MKMETHAIVKYSRLEEKQWVIEIGELLLREDLETAIESPALIFKLSDSICNANPYAYIPRRIALGPHHHLRPELYNLQFYKLHMAKKAKEELQLPDFHQLHDQLMPLDLKIRASFDTHLEICGKTLASIMLVDALFLLRLLLNISAEMQHSRSLCLPLPNFDDQNMFDSEDEKLVSQFQILSDVLKLENQIPFLVIKGILPTDLTTNLPLFLYHFSYSVSPYVGFDYHNDSIIPAIFDQSHHLLYFIYFSILILPMYIIKGFQFYRLQASPSITFLEKWLSVLGSVLNIVFIQQLSEAIGLIQELLDLLWMVKNQSSSSTSQPPLIPSASQLQKLHINFTPATDNGILGTKFIKGHPPTLFLPVISVNAFTETLFENLVAFEAMANINPPVLARYLELMKALIVTPNDLKILKDAKIIHNNLESDEEVVKVFNGVGNSIAALNNNKPSLEKLNHLRRSNGSTSKSELEENEEGSNGSSSESELEAKKGIVEDQIKDMYEERSNGSTSESKLEAKPRIVEEIKDMYEEGLKGIVDEINDYYNSFWRVKAKRFAKKYVYSALISVAILVIGSLIFMVLARLVTGSLKIFG